MNNPARLERVVLKNTTGLLSKLDDIKTDPGVASTLEDLKKQILPMDIFTCSTIDQTKSTYSHIGSIIFKSILPIIATETPNIQIFTSPTLESK